MSRPASRTLLLPAALLLGALAACAGDPPTAPRQSAPSLRRAVTDTIGHPTGSGSVTTQGNYENPSV